MTSSSPKGKSKYLYVIVGTDDQLKNVFIGQLNRLHGRFAWRTVTDAAGMKKEITGRNNIVYRAPPDISAIDDAFFADVPSHYSKRVVVVGENMNIAIGGADVSYNWPVQSDGLTVKRVYSREPNNGRRPKFA